MFEKDYEQRTTIAEGDFVKHEIEIAGLADSAGEN